jgi:hypothetical protein
LFRTLDDATATAFAGHVAKRRATEKRGRKGTRAGLRDAWVG